MLTREQWLQYHRCLALGLGLLFALIGLTGSLSLYRQELDELLNPALVVEQPGKQYLSYDRIMEGIRKAHPNRHGTWTLELPLSPRSMATAWYDEPHETIGEYYAPLMVSINPYTGEVVASRFWGHTVATWLVDLHTHLRLGRWGWRAVGVASVLLMISLASGLYLWWPGLRKLRRALRLRRDAGLVRLAFDAHRLAGAGSAGVLLLLAFTGFNLSYPQPMETLAGTPGMSHGNTGPNIRSTALPNNNPVGLAGADFLARSLFPRAELRRITTPDGNAGVYRLNYRQAGEPNRIHPFTVVWLDRWSGEIREVRNPARFSPLQTFSTWIWPLHTGEAFGSGVRLLWFIGGLAPALLYTTGLWCWLHRRGLVRDRPLDLAAPWPDMRRWSGAAYRRCVPLLCAGTATLAEWLRRLFREGRRRLQGRAD